MNTLFFFLKESSFQRITQNETIALTLKVLEEDEIFPSLKTYLEKLPENKHEIKDTDEVGFVMVSIEGKEI